MHNPSNPLTTEHTHHVTLAACYQLEKFVLKIGFALAKKGRIGKVGGHSHDISCTWQLSWLAVEKPWSALAVPFLAFLTQMEVERLLCFCWLCRGSLLTL